MIRTSTIIGVSALLLSLILHFVGFALSLPRDGTQQFEAESFDAVSLSSTFEDLAEEPIEPVEPEPLEPVETLPEERPAESPTSEVLVASPNPRQTPTPDRGIVRAVRPDPSGPVTPQPSDAVDAETESNADETDASPPEADVIEPNEPQQTSEPAAGERDGGASGQVDITLSPAPSVSAAPVPDVLAALPPELVEQEDIVSVVEPDAQAQEQAQSGQNVTASLRPQLRPDAVSAAARGLETADNPTGSLTSPTELIESPLAAYRRDGTNLFAGPRGRVPQGSGGLGGALGPGNSDVTNYAGEILMHLNRVPPVPVSKSGWARVVFRINPDGSLDYVDIIDGTGVPEIERAARAHVREGAPFPRPPGGDARLLNFIYSIQ